MFKIKIWFPIKFYFTRVLEDEIFQTKFFLFEFLNPHINMYPSYIRFLLFYSIQPRYSFFFVGCCCFFSSTFNCMSAVCWCTKIQIIPQFLYIAKICVMSIICTYFLLNLLNIKLQYPWMSVSWIFYKSNGKFKEWFLCYARKQPLLSVNQFVRVCGQLAFCLI